MKRYPSTALPFSFGADEWHLSVLLDRTTFRSQAGWRVLPVELIRSGVLFRGISPGGMPLVGLLHR